MKRMLITVLFLGVAFGAFAKQAPSVESGERLSTNCVACHGDGGRSVLPNMPSLAGQNEKYLVRQMLHFKNGEQEDGKLRFHSVMTPLMQPFSLADIGDMAAYYAVQKPAIEGAKEEQLALGRQLYQGGDIKRGIASCKGCHQPDGSGNPHAGFPALVGQRADYVELTLKAYKSEKRYNDTFEIMRSIASKLSDTDIKALANYIAGMHSSKIEVHNES